MKKIMDYKRVVICIPNPTADIIQYILFPSVSNYSIKTQFFLKKKSCYYIIVHGLRKWTSRLIMGSDSLFYHQKFPYWTSNIANM